MLTGKTDISQTNLTCGNMLPPIGQILSYISLFLFLIKGIFIFCERQLSVHSPLWVLTGTYCQSSLRYLHSLDREWCTLYSRWEAANGQPIGWIQQWSILFGSSHNGSQSVLIFFWISCQHVIIGRIHMKTQISASSHIMCQKQAHISIG